MKGTKEQRQADQVEELAELKHKQLNDRIPMIEANRNPNFKISAHDADRFVHVYTEIKNVAGDGKSISVEKNTIMIHANQFDQKVAEGFFYSYDNIEIIHDPREQSSKSKEYNTIADFKPGLTSLPQAVDLSKQQGQAPGPVTSRKIQSREKELDLIYSQNVEKEKQLDAAAQKLIDEKAQFEKDKAEFEERKRVAQLESEEAEAKRLAAIEKKAKEQDKEQK